MMIKKIALVMLLTSQLFIQADESAPDEKKIQFTQLILRTMGTIFVSVGNTLIAASQMSLELVEAERNHLTVSILQQLKKQLNKDAWDKMGFGSKVNNKYNAFDPNYHEEIKTGSVSGAEGKSGYTKKEFILSKKDNYVFIDFESCEHQTESVAKQYAKIPKDFVTDSQSAKKHITGILKDEFTQCQFTLSKNDQGVTVENRKCRVGMLMKTFVKKMNSDQEKKHGMHIVVG